MGGPNNGWLSKSAFQARDRQERGTAPDLGGGPSFEVDAALLVRAR